MRKKNNLLYFALFLLSSIGIFYTFFFISPNMFWHLLFFDIFASPLIPLLLFILVFSLIMMLAHKRTHALLAGLFISIYALLRINGFVHPFFFLLLAAIFFLLELFFKKR